LVELAVRKLAVGGRLLFETINPESVYAMKWFWMDLTHVRPVPAPALEQLMTASGLKDVHVDFRSPVPGADALPPGAAAHRAFAVISRLLFAPQDYAVSGVKEAEPGWPAFSSAPSRCRSLREARSATRPDSCAS